MAKQELSKAALTRISWAALIFGVLVILFSALAAAGRQSPGFGWTETMGVILGLFSIVFGYRWRRKARESRW
jgi:NADH:ubiquinone oxidoreductase subunit 3 (subunit A)